MNILVIKISETQTRKILPSSSMNTIIHENQGAEVLLKDCILLKKLGILYKLVKIGQELIL